MLIFTYIFLLIFVLLLFNYFVLLDFLLFYLCTWWIYEISYGAVFVILPILKRLRLLQLSLRSCLGAVVRVSDQLDETTQVTLLSSFRSAAKHQPSQHNEGSQTPPD